ncbi:MAG: hypothetical protein ACOCQX_02475 [Candidatus Nanoarchaeia archaeon]
MRRNTKASLNLSVNAIVVFVLAFAMLGVGLMFTDMIRSKMSDTMGSITEIDDFETPPDPTNPLTINQELSISQGDTKKIKLGFYNKGSPAEHVKVGIKKCIDNQNNEALEGSGEIPNAVSIPADSVPAGEGIGFKFTLDMTQNLLGEDLKASDNDPLYPPGTYTCEFIAYNAGEAGELLPTEAGDVDSEAGDVDSAGDEGYIYEEKQFWLEVTG